MLLERLKSETRAQHARLEAVVGLPMDRAAHLALITGLYGFVAAWEERLAALVPADDPLRAGREKTAWLEADLASFGLDAEARARLPRCAADALPAAATRADLLGVCYVLEGSTLGGQFIARHLRERLGVTNGEGARYFLSYGPEVGARWREFGVELERCPSPEKHAAVVGAAAETFEKLAAWFTARREGEET